MKKKFGNLKVSKHYTDEGIKWGVFGRNQDNPDWTLCNDHTEIIDGSPKWLIFDLEYDACGYMAGFVEWHDEQIMQRKLQMASQFKQRRDIVDNNTGGAFKKKVNKRRKKNKAAKKSRRKNR